MPQQPAVNSKELRNVPANSPEHAAHIEFALWDLNYWAMIGCVGGKWQVETNAPDNVVAEVSATFTPRNIPV